MCFFHINKKEPFYYTIINSLIWERNQKLQKELYLHCIHDELHVYKHDNVTLRGGYKVPQFFESVDHP